MMNENLVIINTSFLLLLINLYKYLVYQELLLKLMDEHDRLNVLFSSALLNDIGTCLVCSCLWLGCFLPNSGEYLECSTSGTSCSSLKENRSLSLSMASSKEFCLL